jgi:NAD(P)H-flavin reductase
VIDNKSLGVGVFLISLRLKLNSFPKPGTFLHIRPWSGGTDPLLRRAFSIFDYDERNGTIDILYKVFGRGSYLLSKVAAGEVIDALGPLGNGFEQPDKDEHLILTAGGVGLPPLYLLAKCALMNGFEPRQITFLCGFGSASAAFDAASSDAALALSVVAISRSASVDLTVPSARSRARPLVASRATASNARSALRVVAMCCSETLTKIAAPATAAAATAPRTNWRARDRIG